MGLQRPRIDFEQFLVLQDELDKQLVLEEITWSEHEEEWFLLLVAAGYTVHEYEFFIDKRWDFLDVLSVRNFGIA